MRYSKYLSLFLAITCLIYSSCSNSANKQESKIAIEDSLIASTHLIDSVTKNEYKLLQTKVNDSILKKEAIISIQNVEKIQDITNQMRINIEPVFNTISSSNLTDVKATLTKKLERYIEVIFQINPEIWMKYRKEFPQIINTSYFDGFNSVADINYFKAKTNNTISFIENKSVLLFTKP